MKTNERIDMQNHQISGLANPIQMDVAVMLEFVASHITGLTDELENFRKVEFE